MAPSWERASSINGSSRLDSTRLIWRITVDACTSECRANSLIEMPFSVWARYLSAKLGTQFGTRQSAGSCRQCFVILAPGGYLLQFQYPQMFSQNCRKT